MSPLHQRLTAVFRRYLSQLTTEALLRRALQDADITPDQLSEKHMKSVVPHLERGIRLFVNADHQDELRRELAKIVASTASGLPPPRSIPIRVEPDISEARMAARSMCAAVNAPSLVVQKVATIVSELARNIVSYTSGGSIELSILEGSRLRLRVRAVDAGSGIGDLDAIMAGRYRSKTGMGKGILGVKRLADSFEIQTGPTGTHVAAELSL